MFITQKYNEREEILDEEEIQLNKNVKNLLNFYIKPSK